MYTLTPDEKENTMTGIQTRAHLLRLDKKGKQNILSLSTQLLLLLNPQEGPL